MKIFSYFENFAFKAFKFDDRASPLEYWCVMPVIWVLIIAMIPGDARAFWDFLLARQIPPLNPFYYESFTLFVVTIIPRLSLTVRRLHDSGKSGKWAKLPYVTVVSSFYLLIAGFAAMASMSSDTNGSLGMMGLVMALVFDSVDTVWPMIFAAAAMLNALGWDAIWAVLSEMTSAPIATEFGQRAGRITQGFQDDPTNSGAVIVVTMILITAPFVTSMLHIFFMISPSKPDHELYGGAPISGASLRQQGEVSKNPFAGYKYLYEKSPDQDAAHKEAAKQEIRSLYQQRVLGQANT